MAASHLMGLGMRSSVAAIPTGERPQIAGLHLLGKRLFG